jgi:2-keto-4-pentenoate hydratase/2-oxohepta-3-ene-1,7-dioic acid hydratase in catechol pathway
MKIICIGRNYRDHIRELNNDRPKNPVVFLKPDTALTKDNQPFYYPRFSQEIHHELELIVRIGREGKHIPEKFSRNYYNQLGIGIDFTARDLQNELKNKGLPWDLSKGFNGAAVVSHFVPLETIDSVQNINLELRINGESRQRGNTIQMMFTVDYIISFVSEYFTLKTGDIIFTGTPGGVGPVEIGDRIEGFMENEKMLDFEVK